MSKTLQEKLHLFINHSCTNGQKEVVKLLLDHQGRQTIDFKARDNDGNTAIEVAFKEGRQSMAKFLQNHPKMKKIQKKNQNPQENLSVTTYNDEIQASFYFRIQFQIE